MLEGCCFNMTMLNVDMGSSWACIALCLCGFSVI